MRWTELHDTLTDLVAALDPPAHTELTVTSAEMTVPLETHTTIGHDGRPRFLARVPHSRWNAGFLPAVHTGRIAIAPSAQEPAP